MPQPNEPYFPKGFPIEAGLLVDVSKEALNADITLPVAMTILVTQDLKPSSYLEDLGVTLDKRISTVLRLIRANLRDDSEDQKIMIPLCIARGPFISEDIITIEAIVKHNESGESVIIITRPKDEAA